MCSSAPNICSFSPARHNDSFPNSSPKPYGHQTYGLLDERLIMLVWTGRGETHHIISMRKCNAREKTFFQARLV